MPRSPSISGRKRAVTGRVSHAFQHEGEGCTFPFLGAIDGIRQRRQQHDLGPGLEAFGPQAREAVAKRLEAHLIQRLINAVVDAVGDEAIGIDAGGAFQVLAFAGGAIDEAPVGVAAVAEEEIESLLSELFWEV